MAKAAGVAPQSSGSAVGHLWLLSGALLPSALMAILFPLYPHDCPNNTRGNRERTINRIKNNLLSINPTSSKTVLIKQHRFSGIACGSLITSYSKVCLDKVYDVHLSSYITDATPTIAAVSVRKMLSPSVAGRHPF